jgi:hypothetical protein
MRNKAKHPPRMAMVLDACWTGPVFRRTQTARKTAKQRRKGGAWRAAGGGLAVA